MAKVKITVLKTSFDWELEGMCDEAWKCMQHYAYALYHGVDMPFGEGWMRKQGVAIVTCNDGIRPVCQSCG